MPELTKHRLEKENYFVSFQALLEGAETLTGTPSVVVARWDGSQWEDVSAEFGTIDPQAGSKTIEGSSHAGVVFTLDEAAAEAQDAGDYLVRVAAITSSGREPIAKVRDPETGELRLPELCVLETADPAAP